MHPFFEKLIARGPVLTDGAWGTELQARGLALGDFPDVWNLLRPDLVADVAQTYIEIGSRVILTNTFGANRLRLAGHALAKRVVEMNRKGVEISRRAAEGRACVFGSMGPSGKMLLTGEITEDELRAAFDEQACALADAGADALVIETMTDLAEATQAVKAARATGLPVIACLVFGSGAKKDRTMMGTTPEEAVQTLEAVGADGVGANCGTGIEGFVEICRRLRAATDLPVWIKPNAGLPEILDGRVVYRTTPEKFARFGPALVEAGADFLGGCCGTNARFIKALKAQICEAVPARKA